MADSTISSLDSSTESSQVGAEDGSLTQITFMDPKLYVAAADGDIDVLKQYDIHVQLTPKKNTVLHVAAQLGQAACVKWVLQLPSPSSLLQQPNEKGDTPIHLAVREGHLTVVKNLIDAAKQLQGDTEGGAAVDCKEMLRMTNEVKDAALHEAVRNHHPEVVKLLIQEDPEFTYGANDEGKTPLYIAAEWGFGDLVQMILDNCTSPAHSGMKGRTALHAAVILNDQAMTKKILEWRPTLTKELDENGWSPLHFAAYVGCHPTIVTQLLEKSETYVVYLGVEDHEIGNRTALHIAASRGHVDIVKLLVSHFPDCCEKVDDKGNNVLHLITPKRVIFLTSGLSNVRWLTVRGLMNEKNVERKTPLHLLHDSPLLKGVNFTYLAKMSLSILDVRLWARSRSFRVGIRPLGSLKVKEDIDSSERKESEEILEIKETIKSHMIVAALIATVSFGAGFTLPVGYIRNGNNNLDMAIAKENFRIFLLADSAAMVLSICANGIYFLASFPIKNKKTVRASLYYGYILIMFAMFAMVLAFVTGLISVLAPSMLEHTTKYIPLAFFLLFLLPAYLIFKFRIGNFLL